MKMSPVTSFYSNILSTRRDPQEAILYINGNVVETEWTNPLNTIKNKNSSDFRFTRNNKMDIIKKSSNRKQKTLFTESQESCNTHNIF